MAKSSRADMQIHRQQIVDVASMLLRERGESGFSVQELMKEVGLTHGGFYKHFSSKEELMGLAAAESFSEMIGEMGRTREDSATPSRAWRAFVVDYLSDDNRNDLAGGCASTGLAAESARAADSSSVRNAYVQGVNETLDALAQYQSHPDDAHARTARLNALITMVGALTLARATAGTDLSDDFITAARELLVDASPELAASDLRLEVSASNR